MANRAETFGLDRELEQKRLAKYDHGLEETLRCWIESMTHASIPQGQFQPTLKDGQILCRLINVIQPGAIKKINTNKMPFLMMENISAYLSACKSIGLMEHDLFMTVDLFESQNMSQVLQNLNALMRFTKNEKSSKTGVKHYEIGASTAGKGNELPLLQAQMHAVSKSVQGTSAAMQGRHHEIVQPGKTVGSDLPLLQSQQAKAGAKAQQGIHTPGIGSHINRYQ